MAELAFLPQKIGILGDGITGKAVKTCLESLGISPCPPEDAQWLIASPGIPPQQFPKINGEIISEIELAYRLFHRKPSPPKLIGITGTNGKSTVTAMLAHCLGCPAAGNFGVPLVNYTHDQEPPKIIAVELSSYQLETCNTFHPEIAIILNLTPDHLERHKTMEGYLNAKLKLIQNLTEKDTLIIGNDPTIIAATAHSPANRIILTRNHPNWTKVQFPNLIGDHNYENALATLIAATTSGFPESEILTKLATFPGLEHRIERIDDLKQRPCYNDSKSTNPDATLIAISAFKNPTHLILGGKDKGLDLKDFLTHVIQKTKSVTLFGEIANRIYTIAKPLCPPNFPLSIHTTLDEALDKSLKNSKPGETILFSPACSSFDQFQNFEDRGQKFKIMVKKLNAET